MEKLVEATVVSGKVLLDSFDDGLDLLGHVLPVGGEPVGVAVVAVASKRHRARLLLRSSAHVACKPERAAHFEECVRSVLQLEKWFEVELDFAISIK